MAVRGVINEFFNVEDFEKQRLQVIDGVEKYIDLIKKVPEIRTGMSDPSKVKETIDGMKQLGELTAKIAELNNKLSDTQAKLNKLTEEANRSREQQTDGTNKGAQAFSKLSGSLQENIAKQVEFKSRLSEISAAMKDLKKQQDLLSKTEGNDEAKKEIKDRIQAYAEEQAQIKVLNSELGRLITVQVKGSESVEGSIKEARAAVAELTIERENQNAADAVGKKRIEEINKEIDKQNSFIEANVDLLSKQRLNIGNYQGSAKIIVDAMERARVKVAEVGKQFGQASPEAQAARHEFESLDRITQNPQFLNIAAKVGDTNKELRFFQNQLNTLEDAGLKNSQVYRDVQIRLSQLTDQIGDTRAEVKALASDTRSFDLFAGAVSFAADTFQAAAGAAVLFGASEEDAAKATKTLIAVQSVANGVKGIANELTTKGTAANKAFAIVNNLVATSFDRSAAASKRFTAALGLIGIAATVIGAIVIAFAHFNKETEETVTRQKVLNDLSREAADNYGKEKASLDSLVGVITTEGSSRKEKLNALKELQEKYPGYFDNLKTESDLNNDLATAYANAAAGILEKARAQAAADKLSKNEADRLRLTLEFQEESEKFEKDSRGRIGKLRSQDRDQFFKDIRGEVELRRSEFNKKLTDIDKENKILLSLTVGQQKKELEIKNKPDPKAAEDAAKKAKEEADKRLLAELEVRKVLFQQIADFNKEVVENEKEAIQARLFSLNQYVQGRTEIINRSAEVDKKVGNKTLIELKLIEENRKDELLRLAREGESERVKILEGTISKQAAITDEEKKMLQDKAKDILKNFEENEQKKRDAAKKTLEERKRIADEEKQLTKKLYDELTNTLTVFFTAGLERRKNNIQEQIDLLDQQKEKDIEVASQSVGTEQERSDKIAIIEARANARKQQLERDQRKLQQDQAKFQKASSIVKIISDTASAIMATLARTPPPAGIPLAVLTGAIGAAQLAAVIAQPIPKYAKGTDDHPGGLAFVGDGGKHEGVKLPDGTLLKTPATSTVVDLPKGSQVFPDFSKMMMSLALKEIPDVKVNVPFDKTERAVRQLGKDLIKTIKDKQETHLHLPGRYDTYMRDGSRFRAYLKENL